MSEREPNAPAKGWVSWMWLLLVWMVAFAGLRWASGIGLYLLVWVIGVMSVVLMSRVVGVVNKQNGARGVRAKGFTRIAIVFSAIMFALVVLEGALVVKACFVARAIAKGETIREVAPNASTIPLEWQRKEAQVLGAREAYHWHGQLHVVDTNNFRRSTVFPERENNVCRILVVGDSLTYGQGVAERETYPAVLSDLLSPRYRVEILNLGRCGDQSEDILKTVCQWVPVLKPDVVVYGVCLNDFLPSHMPEYANNQAWKFPLPDRMKRFFIERTLAGKFLEQSYDNRLMCWGLRVDFFADILRDFRGYQTRFASDVKAMNAFVVKQGLPPVVTMVLDQYPAVKGPGFLIAQAAEKHLTAAGMTVVSTKPYYMKYDGITMYVSKWEGHPNAEAHRIFASYIAAILDQHPALSSFRLAGKVR